MSATDDGVWVTYTWNYGYHIWGIYPSCEQAVRASSDYMFVGFCRFGVEIPEALSAWEKR